MSNQPSACTLKVAGEEAVPLHPHSAAHVPPTAGTLSAERTSAAFSLSDANATLKADRHTIISAADRWLQHTRHFGPVLGTVLVLAAHAIHLLALPLLAAWLGLNAASSPDASSSLLAGHAGHAGHTGSSSLPMRWATDLLAAGTVAAAISMCYAMARSWRNVRSHPLPCILYTAAALLCIGMVLI